MTSVSPAIQPELSTRRQYYVIFVLLLMYVFSYLDRNILALMIDPIKDDLNITDVQFSVVHGVAFGVFYAVFGLPMGYIVDRFSKRWVLFGGISFWSLATVACGLSWNFASLAVARFGVGAGEATLVPAAYSTVTRILPKDRAAMGIAIFSTGSAVGSALAIGVGGYLFSRLTAAGGMDLPFVGHLQPWQAVFVVIGAPGLLMALLSFTIPETTAPNSAPGLHAATEPLLPFLAQNRTYLSCLIGGISLSAVMAYAMLTWMPALLLRKYEVDVAWVGAVLAIASIPSMTGFFVSGYCADRLFRQGRKDGHILPILYCVAPLILLSIIGFHLAQNIWVTVLCYTVALGLSAVGNATSVHIQLATPPSLRGRLAAITVASQHLCGLAFGPLLVALATEHLFHDPKRVGDSIALVVTVIGLVVIVLYALARAPARRAIARREAAEQAE